MSAPSPTLAVHTGGIGDFLLCCPALSVVAQETRLELAGHLERLQLAVDGGIAEKAHSLESIAFDSLLHPDGPSPITRAFLQRFARVIVFMRDDDGLLRKNLQRAQAPETLITAGLPGAGWKQHAAQYYAEALGVSLPERFVLRVQPEQHPFDVIIHPGSGSPKKNWPMQHFRVVAAALEEAGYATGWLRGPAEEGLEYPAGAAVIPMQSLNTSARILAGASCFIGNDSGMTHLAASAGTRTIAVFGPTDARVWAPLGSHVRMVRGAPWPEACAVMDAMRTLGIRL